MEKINKHNYEVFFIDYFDGNLSPAQTEELYQFLNENPDLKEEFENFEEIPVNISDVVFPNKENLKKKSSEIINESNYQEFCIAYNEGDLNEKEEKALLKYVDANNLQAELALFQKAKLSAETEEFFEKDGLKKLLIDNTIELNETTIDEYIIANHEGDLDLQQQLELKEFIERNKKFASINNEYKKVFLDPGKVSFENKSSLKKFSLVTFSRKVIPYASAAAVLLFVVMLFSVNDLENNDLSTLTEIEKKTAVKPEEKNNETIDKSEVEKIIKKDDLEEKEKKQEKIIDNKADNDAKENSLPIRSKQNITPIRKNNPIVSFEGKIQIAALVEKPIQEKEVPLLPDPEFEALLAQRNQKQQEKFYTINELVAEKVKKDILKTDKEKFSLWYVAEAGARGLSKLTGKEYDLETGINEKGNVELIAFNTENFQYTRGKK